MDKRLYLLLFSLLAIGERFNYSHAKAIVGENVWRPSKEEYPFVGSITYKNAKPNPEDDHVCSAVLLTRKHALTAEHCMIGNLHEVYFMIGSNVLYKGKMYKIAHWISYREWAANNYITMEYSDNDISILTLRYALRGSNVKPVTLSRVNIKDLYGTDVTTAGWGVSNNGTVSEVMEAVTVSIIPRNMCTKHVNDHSNATVLIHRSYICTVASPFALIGNGESGGPLLDKNNELIGLNIATCPESNIDYNPIEVNIHLSINYYKTFIDDVIYE